MSGRFAIFFATVLGTWAAIHAYVFWRMAAVPWISAYISKRTLVVLAISLWASYPLARMLNSHNLQWLGRPLELIAANWVGIMFILFCVILVTDIITLGGWPIPQYGPQIRSGAVLAGLGFSLIGLCQGLRQPVVHEYEVSLPGLPRERDGMVMVEVSDIHLNGMISQSWLEQLVSRVNDLHPDLIVAVGDIVDGEAEQLSALSPVIRKFNAPMGVWAVTGNHEFYVGLERSVRFLEDAGCKVLQDRSAQVVPGLVMTGVDDLGARHQFDIPTDHVVSKSFANRPPGATIYLCHTPTSAKAAAANGAGLMLCGHTHNGQIWPFTYLVKMRYPMISGRYEVDGMPVIVCRGTGTWGPRMRLWQPGEIVRITLHRKESI